MCRCEDVTIRHCNVQQGNGRFDVDGWDICSEELCGHSCITYGLASFAVAMHYVECAVGIVHSTHVGSGDGDVIVIALIVVIF